jgi:hypothetical protein
MVHLVCEEEETMLVCQSLLGKHRSEHRTCSMLLGKHGSEHRTSNIGVVRQTQTGVASTSIIGVASRGGV